MTDSNRSDDSTLHSGRLSEVAVHRLCAVAATTGLRPVDAVVEQHAHERDPAWTRLAAQSVIPSIESLLDTGSVEEIDLARIAGKTRFHESANVRDRNAGLLVYALAIAAALDRFGTLLSTQPADEIDLLLSAIAPCVPPGWRAMIDRAIIRHGRKTHRCA